MDERHLQHRHRYNHSRTPPQGTLWTADQLEEEVDGHGHVFARYLVSQLNPGTIEYD